MEFFKLKQLEHSGQGKGAIHHKVIDEFRKGEKKGKAYCESQGYEVAITNVLLSVQSNKPYGFKMSALIKR